MIQTHMITENLCNHKAYSYHKSHCVFIVQLVTGTCLLYVCSKHKSTLSKYKTGVTERDSRIKDLETKLASKEVESQTQLNLIEEEVCTASALASIQHFW